MSEESENLELAESHREHGSNPLTLPVSVTISILAVLVAMATLLGHRAHTEEVLKQALASDQWAYYQAKNIRLRHVQGMADILSVVAPQDKEKSAAMQENYHKEVERYEKEKDEISEKAKDLESERDLIGRRADRYDAGECLLDVGLVICSITLLTRRRFFWFMGMAVGVAGVVITISGLLLH